MVQFLSVGLDHDFGILSNKPTFIQKVNYIEGSVQFEVGFITEAIFVCIDVPPRLWKLFPL